MLVPLSHSFSKSSASSITLCLYLKSTLEHYLSFFPFSLTSGTQCPYTLLHTLLYTQTALFGRLDLYCSISAISRASMPSARGTPFNSCSQTSQNGTSAVCCYRLFQELFINIHHQKL